VRDDLPQVRRLAKAPPGGLAVAHRNICPRCRGRRTILTIHHELRTGWYGFYMIVPVAHIRTCDWCQGVGHLNRRNGHRPSPAGLTPHATRARIREAKGLLRHLRRLRRLR
jgi:hypothetical protein